jgi:predicted lipoprotein with Yx(FWY)xxD motif
MTRSTSALIPMTLAALVMSGVVAFADTGIKEGDSSVGTVLTDANGMTLYTFDKDSDGVSACYDQCAANWPPLTAPADAAAEDDFKPIARTDGSMQWTYYGKPLYLWVKDTNPGDVTGDGVGGVWHVAKPSE